MDDDDAPPPRHRPQPPLWRYTEIGNLIVRALREAGAPIAAKDIKRALRGYGQPCVKMASINQWLRDDFRSVVECRDGKWLLVGDSDYC